MQVREGLAPRKILEEHRQRCGLANAGGLPANPHKDMFLSLSDIKPRYDKLAAQNWRLHKDEGTGVDIWRQLHAEDVFFYQPQTLGWKSDSNAHNVRGPVFLASKVSGISRTTPGDW